MDQENNTVEIMKQPIDRGYFKINGEVRKSKAFLTDEIIRLQNKREDILARIDVIDKMLEEKEYLLAELSGANSK